MDAPTAIVADGDQSNRLSRGAIHATSPAVRAGHFGVIGDVSRAILLDNGGELIAHASIQVQIILARRPDAGIVDGRVAEPRIGVSPFCAMLFAQQVPGPPSFEVATIKPSQDPPGSVSGIFETKGAIHAKNVTLKRCVRGAYNIPEPQIVGGPKWVDQDRYYIEAKAAGPAGDHALMLMLQTLLAERFKLMIHRERRALPGFKLVVGKGGLKAKTSAPDSGSVGHSRRGRIEAEGCTMPQFALKLSEVLHQPVLDATDIAGKFDLKLEWTPDDMQAQPPSSDRIRNASEAGPSIFAAVQEQLGLKLESRKVPAEVLIIDYAERPSPD